MVDTLGSAAVAQQSAAGAANQQSRGQLVDNFETFLTLLTTQLQNQDPLSPTDTETFTQQLVQFSGVEQQLRTNELLASLTEMNRLTAGSTAVSYLGRDVTVASNIAALNDTGSVTWNYELARPATQLSFSVVDSDGRTVAVFPGDPNAQGEQAISWDGRGLTGQQLPAGNYGLVIDALDAGGTPIGARITQQGQVSGVDMSGLQPSITVNGTSLPLSSVIEIKVAAQSGA